MPMFTELKSGGDLKAILATAFDANLDISGEWGYTEEMATIIYDTNTPLAQFEHMFASMRAYLEMNMTQEKEHRYGSINLNELHRDRIEKNNLIYDVVTYNLTAMKEDIYASFINAYKEGYGKEAFDLEAHFKAREEATLKREIIHYFEVSHVS